MILLDEVEDDLQLPAKLHSHPGPTLRRADSLHSFTSSRTLGGLPDYDSSQAQLHPQYGMRTSLPLSSRKKRGCLGRGNTKEGKRFRKAVGVALLIYFAITIVTCVPIVVWKKLGHHHAESEIPLPSWQSNFYSGSGGGGLFDDDDTGREVTCKPWKALSGNRSSEGLYAAGITYGIPLSKDIFIQTNLSAATYEDPLALGALHVIVDSEMQTADAVVNVTVLHRGQVYLAGTTACLVEVGDRLGVSINIPDNIVSPTPLQFNITLSIPGGSSPKYVSKLLTYLPLFNQHIGALSPSIQFGEVQLQGPMSYISVESLQADTINVKSELAKIQGTFNVTTSLSLNTWGAPINADVTLVYGGALSKQPVLDVSTLFGAVDVNVTLADPSAWSRSASALPPAFTARALTSRGPLSLRVLNGAGVSASALSLLAQNSLGEVDVVLDGPFVGSFDVRSDFGTSEVRGLDGRSTEYDPTEEVGQSGWVGDGTQLRVDSDSQSNIQVSSSLRPVVVTFGQ